MVGWKVRQLSTWSVCHADRATTAQFLVRPASVQGAEGTLLSLSLVGFCSPRAFVLRCNGSLAHLVFVVATCLADLEDAAIVVVLIQTLIEILVLDDH